ncbi:hypothetical protein PNEG_00418 [Pneumocystis murina B123]|uniref:U6 snRNA phosphodiesterase n=1 Tax=Pneumocystis murina (strain B123) TaxID=1069680 RepID=M7PLR1_PNEMU|nr:hypothetical protein PNEG_00418 [Pneumocystis murina B123]EMR11394.1 hypothetical protein PNEG_00418 [Pneumocystis murina B123]
MKNHENTELVTYYSEDEEKCEHPREKVPPLPDFFLDLYKVKPKQGNEPEFHEGRTRTYPHVTGGWPSHIYIDLMPNEKLQILLKKIQESFRIEGIEFKSLVENDLGMPLPLHISLSRSLMLGSDIINEFKNTIKTKVIFESFNIKFSNIAIFKNEDTSRTFLVLIIETGKEILRTILQTVDSIVKKYGCQTFYEENKNSKFHVSIAWCLSHTIIHKTIINRLNNEYSGLLSIHKLHVNQVKIKIGNTIHSVSSI